MSLAEWLIHGWPWWLQALAGTGLAVPVLAFVWRLAGPRAAGWGMTAAGVLIALFAHGRRQRQIGWAEREAREKQDAETAIATARRARASADRADPDRLRDDDGFRRP